MTMTFLFYFIFSMFVPIDSMRLTLKKGILVYYYLEGVQHFPLSFSSFFHKTAIVRAEYFLALSG
jgi:hypothetical protein